MPNFFDQFDAPGSTATASGGNPFDRFDVQKPNQPGLISTIKRTGANMASTAATAVEDIAGKNPITQGVIDWGKGVEERNPAGIQSLSDIANNPLLTIKEGVGNMVAQMPVTLGASALGAYGGGAVGGALGGPPGAAVGATIGRWAGAAIPTFLQEYGGIRQDQQEAGIDDKGRALLAAVPATAIEFNPLSPDVKAIRLMAGEEGKKLFGQGGKQVAKDLGKAAAIGAVTEGPMEEYPQSLLESWGAHKDPFSAKEQEQAAVGAVLGAVGGGAMGPINATASGIRAAKEEEARRVAAQMGVAPIAGTPATPVPPAAGTTAPAQPVAGSPSSVADTVAQAVAAEEAAANSAALSQGGAAAPSPAAAVPGGPIPAAIDPEIIKRRAQAYYDAGKARVDEGYFDEGLHLMEQGDAILRGEQPVPFGGATAAESQNPAADPEREKRARFYESMADEREARGDTEGIIKAAEYRQTAASLRAGNPASPTKGKNESGNQTEKAVKAKKGREEKPNETPDSTAVDVGGLSIAAPPDARPAPVREDAVKFAESRTDGQLAVLAKSGRPGYKEAAVAEISRRSGMSPKSVSGTSEKSSEVAAQENKLPATPVTASGKPLLSGGASNEMSAGNVGETLPNSGSEKPKSESVDSSPTPSDKPFDSAAWNKARSDRIKASKAAGNRHLDQLHSSVEGMRGLNIYSAHDPKERGKVRTVSNHGDVVVHWADQYSANKNSATPIEEKNKAWLNNFGGQKETFESWLSPSDLVDYVVDDSKQAPEVKPKPTKALGKPLVAANETAPDAPQTPLSSAGETQAPRKNPGTKSNPPPIMRRDDLVGAIMRVTGGNGIHSSMAPDTVGDNANRATKLRGLFTNRGTTDLGDVAMLLRESENFDVRDGEHLAELIRQASFGDVPVSMERQERDAETAKERKHRDRIRAMAKKYKLKTDFVKFSVLEGRVLYVERQRHKQAVNALTERDKKRFEAAVQQLEGLVSEEEVGTILRDVNERPNLDGREKWKEARRLLEQFAQDARHKEIEGAIDRAEQSTTTEEPDWFKEDDDEADTGSGNGGLSAEDHGKDGDRVQGQSEPAAGEERESGVLAGGEESGQGNRETPAGRLELTGQTQQEAAAAEAEAKAQANREAKAKQEAEKAKKEAETKAEIKLRSEAAASTFELGGNAMDNLTGQGSVFDAPPPSPAPVKKEEPPAISGYKNQPESFDWAAKDVGGKVVYSHGDIALLEGFSLFGNPVYTGIKGDSRTSVDIESYTGKMFSDAEKAELLKARSEHIAEQDRLHATNPDGPFNGGARFAKTDGISAELAGVAQKWLSMLGIKSRVFLATKTDVSSFEAIDQYGLRGPFAAIRSAGVKREEDGGMRALPNGDYYIILPPSIRQSAALETLAHEIGHILEKEEWKTADQETKNAVMADFQKWLETAGNASAKEWVTQLRAHTTGKQTNVVANTTADKLPAYWRSFGEYFADQVSRWATTTDKPLTAVDAFFKRIALAMRRLYSVLAGRPYLPSDAMKKYLDSRSVEAPLETPVSAQEEPPLQSVTIGQFRHTKTGLMQYSVAFKDKVSPEIFAQAKAIASREKTRWSAFKGGGAIPGFLFASEAKARQFAAEIDKLVKPAATKEQEAPALADNQVRLPGNPYTYTKHADGRWSWAVSPAPVAKPNFLGANAEVIPKAEKALAEKRGEAPQNNSTPAEPIDSPEPILSPKKYGAEAFAQGIIRPAEDSRFMGAYQDRVGASEYSAWWSGYNEAKVAANEADIIRLKKKRGAPFEYQQEMAEKYGELKRLEEELQSEGEKISTPEQKTAPKWQDDARNQRMAPVDGLLYNAATDNSATPADRAIYSMASEGKSAAEILSFIGKASRRPFNRYLANALRNLGAASTITLDSQGGWQFGNTSRAQKYAAAYNPKTDSVALFTPRDAERHLLHELTHAATLKAIAAGGPASLQMRALFNYVKRNGALAGQYGMSNLDEFVAEAFSNPKFQQALKAIPAPKGSLLKSAWEWFVRAVRSALGMKSKAMETALDRVMREGAALMRENAALAGKAQGNDRYAIAWHGTPHVWAPEPGFPHGRPRLDKMGTGEGAQAYGWGWYSAEARDVAGKYAGKLSSELRYNGRLMSRESGKNSMASAAWAVYLADGDKDAAKRSGLATHERIDAINPAMLKPGGTLYQLDIPDDVLPHLLDWDKPLSEQTDEVRAALAATSGYSFLNTPGGRLTIHGGSMTGLDLYQELESFLGDSKRKASEYLASIGIVGNRYLDGNSRADGNGTSNFVIWDQPTLDRIALLERNGEKLDAIREADAVRFSAQSEWDASQARLKVVRNKLDEAGIDSFVSERNGVITLSHIIVPKNERNSGKGTEAMNQLVAYADETGQTIVLSPSSDFGGNKARLIQFYRRFGFVPNSGRNKDFRFRETMLRRPKPEGIRYNIDDTLPETISVDGIDRPTTNSKGQPIHPTEEGVRRFYEWFGDSKVVDERGRPLVVLHGTRSTDPFHVFDTNRQGALSGNDLPGAYFTERKSYAMAAGPGLGEPVGAYYLNIRIPADGNAEADARYLADDQQGKAKRGVAHRGEDGRLYLEKSRGGADVRSRLEAQGFDGVRREMPEEHIAFRPEQIKSATDNTGAFSPDNPDIRYNIDDIQQGPQDDLTIPANGPTKAPINASRLLRLRREAAAIERPEDAVFLRITDDGRAIATGPKGVRVPETFRRFAADNGLTFFSQRGTYANPKNQTSHASYMSISGASTPMPVPYRTSGAMYFGEMGDGQVDRADRVRFNIATDWYNGPSGAPVRNAWQAAKAKAAEILSPKNLDKIIYEMQDKYVDLKRLRDHIKAIGGTITDMNDAYLGEELYHQRLAYRTEKFGADELLPLQAEMRAKGISQSELETFLHARHAPEANAEMAKRNPNQGEIDAGRKQAADAVRDLELQLQRAKATGSATHALERALNDARGELSSWNGAQAFRGTEEERTSLSGMSDSEAAAIMAGLAPKRRSDLESLAARVDAINEGTLQLLDDYGLMPKAALTAWRNTYQHYIPLHRDEAHPDSLSHPIGQGFNVKGDAAKRRTGSNQKVTNILGHIAMQREAALTRGEKNHVMLKLYLMARQNPLPDVWKVGAVPMTDTIDKATGFVKSIPDPLYKTRPNVLVLRVGGKDVAITINEHNPEALRMAHALKNLDVDDLHYLIPVVGKATRWFASMNTQHNPIFGIINLMRDTQEAALNLSTTELAGKQGEILKDQLSILKEVLQNKGRMPKTGKWAAIFAELKEVGGTTGYRDLFLDAESRGKALQDTLKSLDRGKASQAAHAVADWLSDYNEAMENATRLAAYKAGIDSGMSKERAASLAKNLTVNFNRKGRQTRELGALYAFFNAAVQGTTRMAQTLAGPAGRKIMAGGVLIGALNALLGIAMMGGGDGDDDEWEKIPEFVKERSIIIPIGNQDYLSIPMPLGFQFLPNIGRLAVEMAVYKDKTAGKQMASLFTVLADAFNPLGGSSPPMQIIAPTVMDPFVALAQNKDWTGRPIYIENRNNLDPKPGLQRSKDSATPWAKGFAEAINAITGGTEYTPGGWSPTPDQIDYVIGQLTGGVGREAGKVASTLSAPLTGEELPAHKIPLAGRLYGSTSGTSGQSERFYENITRANAAESEIKGRARDGLSVAEYLRDNPGAVELAVRGNAAEKQVSALRKMRRDAVKQGGPEATGRVRDLNERMAAVMRDFNNESGKVGRRAEQ